MLFPHTHTHIVIRTYIHQHTPGHIHTYRMKLNEAHNSSVSGACLVVPLEQMWSVWQGTHWESQLPGCAHTLALSSLPIHTQLHNPTPPLLMGMGTDYLPYI